MNKQKYEIAHNLSYPLILICEMIRQGCNTHLLFSFSLRSYRWRRTLFSLLYSDPLLCIYCLLLCLCQQHEVEQTLLGRQFVQQNVNKKHIVNATDRYTYTYMLTCNMQIYIQAKILLLKFGANWDIYRFSDWLEIYVLFVLEMEHLH